jgi:outer membrane usher protein
MCRPKCGGRDSRIFARGLEDKGALVVKWGDGAQQQCRVEYELPKQSGKAQAAYLAVQEHSVGATSTQAKAE